MLASDSTSVGRAMTAITTNSSINVKAFPGVEFRIAARFSMNLISQKPVANKPDFTFLVRQMSALTSLYCQLSDPAIRPYHRGAVASGDDIILESDCSQNRLGQFQKCKLNLTSMDGAAEPKCIC